MCSLRSLRQVSNPLRRYQKPSLSCARDITQFEQLSGGVRLFVGIQSALVILCYCNTVTLTCFWSPPQLFIISSRLTDCLTSTMRTSQADSVVSTSTTAPLQVGFAFNWVCPSPLPCTAAHTWCSGVSPQTTADQLLPGKFFYKDGSTYEGQYKLLGLAPAADAAPAKKGLKKKDDEAPAQPAEPPKPVRHGAGQLVCIMRASSC